MFSSSAQATPAASDRLTVLAPGMALQGDIETDGVIRIEGTVEGSIRAAGQVLVARGGVVHGDIHTHGAVVGGRVVGSLTAEDRVEIEDGALVEGDLITPRLIVQEGGNINGRVSMVSPEAAERTTAPDPEPALEFAVS